MSNVKIGFAQIANPTPTGINLWVRVFTVTALFFLTWMHTNTLIASHTQDVISTILEGVCGFINVIAPLFGIQVDSNAKVSVGNVSAMDSEEKKP